LTGSEGSLSVWLFFFESGRGGVGSSIYSCGGAGNKRVKTRRRAGELRWWVRRGARRGDRKEEMNGVGGGNMERGGQGGGRTPQDGGDRLEGRLCAVPGEGVAEFSSQERLIHVKGYISQIPNCKSACL